MLAPHQPAYQVKGEANPHDSADPYFEEELERQTGGSEKGAEKTPEPLAKTEQTLTPGRAPSHVETGWGLHHIVPLMKGGRDIFQNQILVLIHAKFHRHVHRQIRILAEPGSARIL